MGIDAEMIVNRDAGEMLQMGIVKDVGLLLEIWVPHNQLLYSLVIKLLSDFTRYFWLFKRRKKKLFFLVNECIGN